MGYVKAGLKAAIILALLTAVGCGTTATQPSQAPVAAVKLELAPTLDYIPKLKVDKQGQPLPYKAATNPYLKARGSIKKVSVEQFIIARRAYKAEDFSTAEETLKQLVTEEKRLSGPWVMLGDIALKQQRTEEAIDHFYQALSINKSNVNAYIRLAQAQRIQGQFIQAQNTYAKALSIWRDFPEGHLNLAVLYDVYLNDPLKAQRHMEAYQFLTDGRNQDVAAWLEELKQRTGAERDLRLQQATANTKPLS